jgi:indole-3-glycerol phosphate synthase
MSRLDEIFAHKRVEVAQRMAARPLAEVTAAVRDATPPRDFIAGLRTARRPALIAEIKAASPSRGVLVADFDPLRLARVYAENGAAAISVLTDERFFRGSLAYLTAIRAVGAGSPRPIPGHETRQGNPAPTVPILQKDFICSTYQIYEARAAGADAILLIVAGLDVGLLAELHALACSLGMAALVEVHTAEELNVALALSPTLVGVNARNLHDFTINLDTTIALAVRVPAHVCMVAESGIHNAADVARLMAAQRASGSGVDAILVGEALVTAADTAAKVRELSGRAP